MEIACEIFLHGPNFTPPSKDPPPISTCTFEFRARISVTCEPHHLCHETSKSSGQNLNQLENLMTVVRAIRDWSTITRMEG